MPVADTVKDIAHGIGFLVPGVSQEQALQTATNHRQRTALANMLENAYRHETDPSNFDPNDQEARQRVSSLLDMQSQLQALGPFDSPKKLFAKYGEYVANHPHALMPAGSQPQGPSLAPPGPASPGQTPGTQAVIPPVDQTAAAGGGAPAAAAPGTSPVQPERQGGASGQNAPFRTPDATGIPPVSGTSTSQPGGVGDSGDQQAPAAFSIDASGVGPTPGITLPTLPQRPVPRLPQGMYTGTPELAQTLDTAINASTQLQHPAVQAQAATDQALATLRSTAEFNNANAQHKIALLKQTVGPEVWAQLPPVAQTEIVADALGMKLSGMGSLYTPHTMSTGALGADLLKSNPALRTESGDALEPGTLYDEKIIAGRPVAVPIKPEVRVGSTATGEAGTFNPLNPSAGIAPVPGSAGKTDFDTYLQTYLKEHKLNLTPYTMRAALAEWTSAGQKPPQNMMLVPDDKTGQWVSQIVKPGTKVDPRAVTVGGLSNWNVPTSAVRTQGQLATALVPEGDKIKNEIRQLSSVVGPLMGRGYRFAINKVGADFPEFAGLDTRIDAFATAFMKAHGYRSKEMHDAILKQLSAAQSPDDLIARVDSLEDFLKGYTSAGTAGKPTAPPTAPTVPPITGNDPAGVRKFIKK